METGFKEHLGFGLVSLIFAFAFATHSSSYPPLELFTASLLFLAASVLPDADAPFSFVRRGLRVLALSVFFVFALFTAFYFHNPLSSVCPPGNSACFWAALAITLVLPFALVEALEFFIPGHRGPLHSLGAAVVFGVLSMGATGSLIAGVFAFLGYFSHLVFDFFGSRF